MNATESDLRSVFGERVSADVVDDLEDRLRATLDEPRTDERGRRSRYLAVGGVVAAMAAAAVLAAGLVGGTGPRHHGVDSPRSPAVAAVRPAFSARVDAGSQFRTVFHSVTAERELIGLNLSGASNARCQCSNETSSAVVAVYRRGFDPRQLDSRARTTFAGRSAWTGEMPTGMFDAMTNSGTPDFATLAFQYVAGSWAIVQGRIPTTAKPAVLRQLAASLHVGEPESLTVPFRLDHGHGLHILSYTVETSVDGAPSGSTVVLSNQSTYGGDAANRSLLLELMPDRPDASAYLGDQERVAFEVGGHAGRMTPMPSTSRTPDAYFRVHGTIALLSGQGLYGKDFLDLVEHVAWPEHISADRGTWVPASDLVPGN